MRIAVCDDEKNLRRDLRRLVEIHMELKGIPCEIVEYESGERLLRREKPIKQTFFFWILKCRERAAWKQRVFFGLTEKR